MKNKGISLIILVITIIVIIILATAVILTLNQSGIINKAEEAAVLTEIGNIEDSASLIYMEMLSEKYTNGGKNPEFADIVNELIKRGYEIETVVSSVTNVTDILLDKEEIIMAQNDTKIIKVTLKTDDSSDIYYAKIREKYYKLININGGVKVERTPSNIDNTEAPEITASVTSGNTVTVGSINQNEITINSNENKGTSEITVTYGSLTKICVVNIIVKPSDNAIATNTEPKFSTNYGRIEVIWLDTNNNVRSIPNAPNLYSGENALKPVTWSFDETTKMWTEDSVAKNVWYDYKSIDGLEDNRTSQWANAKNSDGSYFVWIPRYAYRILYYANDKNTTPLGYYDGNGLWNAENDEVSYALDSGIETVEYNGYKYIVHPAFETNLDNGGWDKDLEGFWVAKYEMSRVGATVDSVGSGTTFLSIPSVQSARNICIGDMYQYSRSYDKTKESHMMKNSEWGAVAYLTQSKYGRNGHEININNSRDCITGNGGNGVGGSVSFGDGIRNAYNTEKGAKASTTGNVYGVYDMSGGAYEYTAVYDEKGDSNYVEGASYGLNMTKDAKNTSGEYISTKYVTKYTNGTSDFNSVTKIREVSKIGDGIKEVRRRDSYGWYGDYSSVVHSSGPFIFRGGCNDSFASGVFSASRNHGYSHSYYSFRVCLGL